MSRVKTKSLDRTIAFEIGVIIALLLVYWFINLSYQTEVSFDPILNPEPDNWTQLISIEEEETSSSEEQKAQDPEPMEMRASNVLDIVSDLVKLDKKDKKRPVPKRRGPIFPLKINTGTKEANRVDTFVHVMPQFPGGELALASYVQDHFNTRGLDQMFYEQVSMVVGFTVNRSGDISDIQLLMSNLPHDVVEPRLKKLLQEMPLWTPGDDGYGPVNVHLKLPIKISFY